VRSHLLDESTGKIGQRERALVDGVHEGEARAEAGLVLERRHAANRIS